MSPIIAPQFTKATGQTFSCPGKVFLLGEYAVLAGTPAWVATVEPRFEFQFGIGEAIDKLFHPKSPASGLLTASNFPLGTFKDPFAGRGGLGASTAQFALIFHAIQNAPSSWREALLSYRKLTAHEALPPSGADLVAQWVGGIVRFDPSALTVKQLYDCPLDWDRILVFSATEQPNRKVTTYQHLEKLKNFSKIHAALIRELRLLLQRADAATQAGVNTEFGNLLTLYGDLLAKNGLELAATSKDRAVLSTLPGVTGIKGTGALQADGIIIHLDPQHSDRAQIIAHARDRKLFLISNGLKNHKGVT